MAQVILNREHTQHQNKKETLNHNSSDIPLMLNNFYQHLITGYWRCYTIEFSFDYYVREDGFHIAGIPELRENGGKLMPMCLWLTVDSSHQIIVHNGPKTSTWTRSYYRDGKRLIILDYSDPDTRSVSYPIQASDLSEEMAKMVDYFNTKYAKL